MEKIVEIQLAPVKKRLKEREVTLKWTDALVKHLAEEGYDPVFGARPLKRLIQQQVLTRLSKEILEGKILSGQTIELDYKNKELTWRISK